MTAADAGELEELVRPVEPSAHDDAPPAKRGPGRPRKDGKPVKSKNPPRKPTARSNPVADLMGDVVMERLEAHQDDPVFPPPSAQDIAGLLAVGCDTLRSVTNDQRFRLLVEAQHCQNMAVPAAKLCELYGVTFNPATEAWVGLLIAVGGAAFLFRDYDKNGNKVEGPKGPSDETGPVEAPT